MDREFICIKEQKLRTFAKMILSTPSNKREASFLLEKLNLTEEKVIDAYVFWDLDVLGTGNEIYDSLAFRMGMHLHNLLPHSWHQRKQQEVLSILKKAQFRTIADIGFGTPQKYVRELILEQKKIKLTLFDADETAITFGKTLLDLLAPDWEKNITLKIHNMNFSTFVGEFDIYLFQDSIEHAQDPTEYLKQTVKQAPESSMFILVLPIGPPTGGHHIEWEMKEDALAWLNKCGLAINESIELHINRNIDLYAEQLGETAYELLVACHKIKS